MPKKTAATPETNPETGEESILVTAAKAMVKKTKSKLPRKEKKAAAAKAAKESAK